LPACRQGEQAMERAGGTAVLVIVGRIGRAHGIKGEVGLVVRTDEPDRRFADGAKLVTTEKSPRTLTIAASRWHSGRLLVKFAESPDRTAAELLRNLELQAEIGEDERPEDPEEFYDRELIGLSVRTTDGVEAGEVIDVVHLPSQDLLEIRRPAGNAVLVPLVEELVPEIDLGGGYVVVADRPGLLDPEGAEVVPTDPAAEADASVEGNPGAEEDAPAEGNVAAEANVGAEVNPGTEENRQAEPAEGDVGR
jgi:16S rRNA processing protein RimM